MKRFLLVLASLLALASPARGQNYLACQVNGIVTTCPADARLKTGAFLLNPYVNWAAPGTLGSGTASTVRGTTVTATTQFTGSGAGLTSVPAASIAGSLSGVVIDCSSNTCSNIANAALTNSSLTVTAGAGLSGGGAVSLGGSVALSLPNIGPGAGAVAYPASITLDAQGRVSAATSGSAPAVASRLISTSTGLQGGGDLSADRTLSIASTTVTAASYPTSGQIPTFTVNAQGQLTAASSTTTLTSPVIGGSPSLTANLAAGSNKITGLATATVTGDALAYPWITGTAAIQVLGSTYTVTVDNGAYEDTGLSVTLPSAGTYIVWYTARTNISAAVVAGAFIEVQLYNSTDSSALANSEQIGAYGSTVATSYYGTPNLITTISVAASKTIKLYAKCVAPSSTTVRTINSDTNGRTNLGYMKITP